MDRGAVSRYRVAGLTEVSPDAQMDVRLRVLLGEKQFDGDLRGQSEGSGDGGGESKRDVREGNGASCGSEGRYDGQDELLSEETNHPVGGYGRESQDW